VGLAVLEIFELRQGQLGGGIGGRADAQGDEGLLHIEAYGFFLEDVRLEGLDGIGDVGGQELDLVGDPGQVFDCMDDHAGGGVEEGRIAPVDDGAVLQFQSGAAKDSRVSFFPFLGLVRGVPGGNNHGAALFRQQFEILHEKLNPLDGFTVGEAHDILAPVTEVATDDLHLGSFPGDGVVDDGETGAVHPHVGWGTVKGRFAGDLFQDAPEDGKYLHVPVVVDRRLAVGLEVERVDEIEVPDIGGGRLVGHVHRVFQGQVPDGEGLELGVSRFQPAFVIVI